MGQRLLMAWKGIKPITIPSLLLKGRALRDFTMKTSFSCFVALRGACGFFTEASSLNF